MQHVCWLQEQKNIVSCVKAVLQTSCKVSRHAYLPLVSFSLELRSVSGYLCPSPLSEQQKERNVKLSHAAAYLRCFKNGKKMKCQRLKSVSQTDTVHVPTWSLCKKLLYCTILKKMKNSAGEGTIFYQIK